MKAIILVVSIGLVSLGLFIGYGVTQNKLNSNIFSSASAPEDANLKNLLSYDISYSSRGEAAMSILAAGNPKMTPITVELRAKVYAKIQKLNPNPEVLAHMDVEQFELHVEGQSDQSLKEELNRLVFRIRYDADGRVTDIDSSQNTSASARGILVQLASCLQMPASVQAPLIRKEEDINGSFEAAYQRSGPDFIKHKIRYTQSRNAYSIQNAAFTLGHSDIPFLPQSFSGQERLTIIENGKDMGWSEQTYAFNRKNLKSDEQRRQWNILLQKEKSAPPTVQDDQRDRIMENKMAENRLQGATLEKLMALARDVQAGIPGVDSVAVERKIVAYARLHPEACDELMEAIKDAGTKDFLLGAVLVALAEADSTEAQKALNNLLEHRQNDLAALPTLYGTAGQIKNPQPEFFDAVHKTFEDGKSPLLKEMSGLALSAMGHELPEGERGRFNALAQELSDKLLNSRDPNDVALYLRMIGNLGPIQLLPVLMELKDSPNPDLRVFALEGMRFIPSPEVDRVLTQILIDARDEPAMSAALRALSYRLEVPEHIQAYKSLVENSKVVITFRSEALERFAKSTFAVNEKLAFLAGVISSRYPEKLKEIAKDYRTHLSINSH